MNKIRIIIAREFNERVRKKSFIITTILMPVLMLALMAAPTLMMVFAKGDTKHLLVIDNSGIIAPKLENGDNVVFEPTDKSIEQARNDTDVFGVLWIGEDIVDNPTDVKLYTNASSSMALESSITSQMERIIENERLKRYNIENLEQIMKDVKVKVSLSAYRTDLTDGAEPAEATSSALSYALGGVMGMILYMFLIIYGSMVMTTVIEEKGSRVLDVLVTSVSPFQLMTGKILGVASVAATQVAIWAVLICGVGAAMMSALVPADMMETVRAVEAGAMTSAEAGVDADLISAVSLATNPAQMVMMFLYLLLFLVGGFLFYSAMFAAVGSSVDSIQDAQQLQTPITIPIILGFILMMTVFEDPNSTIAFWGSIIPFTSPIVMLARIPSHIPTWQIVLSLVVLYASVVAMVWIAARIYRVGILMHGKRPSFKELLSWIKQ